MAKFPPCRPSKNSEQEGAGNGRFAPEGARSVVAYITARTESRKSNKYRALQLKVKDEEFCGGHQ